MRRAILIVAGALVAIALAVGSLAGLILVTGQPRAMTTGLSEWALTQALGTETRVQATRGSLLRGLELSGIEVGRADPAALVIDRARLEIEPWPLLDGRIEVRLLRLVGLSIEGIQQEDNRWRWAGGLIDPSEEAAPSSESEPTQSVVVHAIELEDVRFHLAWWGGPAAMRLDARLDADLAGLVWPLVDAEGWLPDFEARLGDLSVTGGRLPIRQGALTARHDGGAITLSARDIVGPWGSIEHAAVETTIEGGIEAPRIEGGHAEAEFSDLDPGSVLDGEWPASTIAGRTRFDWQDQEASGELFLDPFNLFGVPVDSAEAHGRVWFGPDDFRFDLESLQIMAPLGEVEAHVTGNAESATELVIERARLDVAELSDAWRPSGWTGGTVAFQATLSGPWDSLTGDLALRLGALNHVSLGSINGELDGRLLGRDRLRVERLELETAWPALPDISSRKTFVVGVAQDMLTIEGASFNVDRGEVEIDGALSSQRFDALRVQARGLELAQILRGFEAPDLGGTLSGDVVIDGSFEEPGFRGEIDWQSPSVGEVVAERALFTLEPVAAPSAAQQVRLELVRGTELALGADASFSTKGVLGRPAIVLEDRTARLTVEARDLDVDALARLVGDEQPAGRLNAKLTAHGPLLEPFLEGRIDWTDAVWRDLEAERIFAVIRSSDETGDAHFELGAVQQGRESVRAGIEINDRRLLSHPVQLLTHPGTKGEVELDAFDLTTLWPFLIGTGVDVEGTANGRVHFMAGTVPDVHGEVRFDRLKVSGSVLPVVVGPTPVRFDFTGQIARTTEILIPSADGAAYVRGQVSWDDPSDPQIQLRARSSQFAVELPGIIDARVDGDAVVFGTPTALTGEGGLVLHHARIDLPDPEDRILNEISVKYATPTDPSGLIEGEDHSLYDALEGQLSLGIGESVWLHGVGARLELQGDLVARKQRNEPTGLYGSVEVVSGRIDFQGKWLRVTTGSAVFDGNADPDPYIDVTALHRVGEVSIRARLFGRASALVLELDSDPPMSGEDQLSYLLFDRAVADVSAIEQQSVTAMAAMLAGDYLLGRVGSELLQEIGIDRVRLGVDENDSPTIEIEKQVHERVTLRYGRGFGVEGGDRFVVEWRLFRKLFVSGEQLTNGESGVDMFWRRDY